MGGVWGGQSYLCVEDRLADPVRGQWHISDLGNRMKQGA